MHHSASMSLNIFLNIFQDVSANVMVHCTRMGTQVMVRPSALVLSRTSIQRLCPVNVSTTYPMAVSAQWNPSSRCYYSCGSQRPTACVQNHNKLFPKKTYHFVDHHNIPNARCLSTSHTVTSYTPHHHPRVTHPLYHGSCLKLRPGPSNVTSRRHFSRETFAYYLSSDFPPIGFAKTVLLNIHEMTGLPWWATIMMTTFTLRTLVTLPFSIYSTYILAKVESLGPEIGGMSQQLKKEVAIGKKKYGWDQKTAIYQFNINVSYILFNGHILISSFPSAYLIHL